MDLPDFKSAEERTQYIKDNADYFTVTYRENYQNKRAELPTIKLARNVAKEVANWKKRPVMIYAVVKIPGTANGLDTWAETIKPDVNPYRT